MKAYFTDSTEAWNFATAKGQDRKYKVNDYGIDSLNGQKLYWIDYERKEDEENGEAH